MKNTYLSVFFAFALIRLSAQSWHVEAVIENLQDQKIYLSSYYQSAYKIIDSTFSTNGSFYFSSLEEQKTGMFRISFETPEPNNKKIKNWYIDFIWNKENISVFAKFPQLANTLNIENSKENEVLDYFRKYENNYEQKMSVLFSVTDRYPDKDSYYFQTKKQLYNLQHERDSILNLLINENSELYVSKIIASYKTAHIPEDIIKSNREKFMKEYYFKLAPIDDPLLLTTPIYSKKIISFLKLFGNQSFSFKEQEDAFIEAIDIIMANTAGEKELRGFVVEFLIDGFESFGMERVQTHIFENYLEETCETDASELAKHRIEGYKKMAIGQVAKDIRIRTYSNEIVKLSDIKSDYTLVLFWATHCEHCMKMVPKLLDWYMKDKADNIEIFAVSIDTVKANWQKYMSSSRLPWVNAHEPMGWEGRSAADYNIYATPSMFLLDKNRRIIARPYNLRELKKVCENVETKPQTIVKY